MSSINLPLILTLAVLITGIIWLIDILVFARPRKLKVAAVEQQFQGLELADEHKKEAYETAKAVAAKEPIPVEYAKSFFPVLFIVFFTVIMRDFCKLAGKPYHNTFYAIVRNNHI